MSFLNLMRNRLKPKEVNDALTDVQGRVLPVTTSATAGQMLGLTGENKTPAWVDNPLPSTGTATTGQILKLTGESKTPAWADEYSYTPPAYSETEVNTGQKWIDGKDIYSIAYSGTLPVITETTTIDVATISTGLNVINAICVRKNSSATILNPVQPLYYIVTGKLTIQNVGAAYSESPYWGYVFYTKPDPVPGDAKGPEEPEEPEEKKTTKKKTTKKETNN